MRRKKLARGYAEGRRALLVDLENLVYDGATRLPASTVEDRIRRIMKAAGRIDHALAVAPAGVVQAHAPALAATNLRWELCPPGVDSADATIVRIALDLISHGYTQIVVASADHYFSRLGRKAQLFVVVPNGSLISRRLLRAAYRVEAA